MSLTRLYGSNSSSVPFGYFDYFETLRKFLEKTRLLFGFPGGTSHLYLPKRSLSALSKHSRPLFIGRLGFWNICVGARVPSVVYVGHPRHSNTVQGFPADDAWHRTPREAILPNPLDNQRAKLSIGPVNKTGGPDPLSFCLLLQTRQNYAFGATLKTVLSRPIRDTGGAEHPRGRQYT